MNRTRTPIAIAAVLALLTTSHSPALAASAAWDGDTNGNWVTGANWVGNPATAPGVVSALTTSNQTTDVATFNSAGNSNTSITVDLNRIIRTVVFDTANAAAYSFGGSTLTLDTTAGGAGITVNSTVVTNQAFNVNLALLSAPVITNNGSGLLTLNGAINRANFTGGTITFGGTGDITLTRALVGDTNLLSTIANVNKNGTGILRLNRTNSHTGTTTINAGSIYLARDGALGDTTNGTVVNSGGSLAITSSVNYATAENLTLNGTGASGRSGALDAISSGDTTFAGAITLGSAATIGNTLSGSASTLTLSNSITAGANHVTFNTNGAHITANAISGTSLNKTGSGVLTLNAATTLSGTFTLINGTIRLGNGGAINGRPVAFDSNANTKTLQLNGNSANVGGFSTGGVVGTSVIENANALAATLTQTGVANYAYDGVIRDGTGGGALTLTKSGSGMLTLGGGNSYTGATNLNAGTLLVNGTHTGGGLYTVDAGARLGGNGSIGASVVVNGTFAPGNSIDDIAVGGNFTLNNVFEVEVAGAAIDLLNITGNLTLGGASVLDILGTLTQPTYTIMTYTGVLSGAFFDVSDATGQSYSVDYSVGGQVRLVQAVAIPAPAALPAGVMALALLASRRRR